MAPQSNSLRSPNRNIEGFRHSVSIGSAALGVEVPQIVYDCQPHCPRCGMTRPKIDNGGLTFCCGLEPCRALDVEWHIHGNYRACCPGMLIRSGIYSKPQESKPRNEATVVDELHDEEEASDRRTWLRARRRLKKKLELGKISELMYHQKLDELGEDPGK